MPDAPLPTADSPPGSPAAKRRASRGTLITLAVLFGLVAVVVLLTPVSDNAGNDTYLTTKKYGPGNARLAADLARNLGWQVQVAAGPLNSGLDTTVIYAVFGGPTPMPLAERNAVTEAVRRGAGLLLAPSDADFPLPAALGLRTDRPGRVEATPLGTCPPETDRFASLRVRPSMLTYDTTTPERKAGSERREPFPAGATVLLSSVVDVDTDDDADSEDSSRTAMRRDGGAGPDSGGLGEVLASVDSAQNDTTAPKPTRPSAVAFPLGRGRVVALADPDLLRTDQMRSCAMGTALTFVRGLEYLSEGRQRTIVFAEYYQSARTDGPGTVLGEWLRRTGLGRMVLALMFACLVLLIARGRRTLAPVYRIREERRSALEHVDALATAWQAVRGTRTVARMLARGIRRRHAAGRWRSLDDTAFLAALAARHPAITDDASRLAQAIATPAAPSDLRALREAAAHIDAECLTP